MNDSLFFELYKSTFDKLLASQLQIAKLTEKLRAIKNGEHTYEPCNTVPLGKHFKVNLN